MDLNHTRLPISPRPQAQQKKRKYQGRTKTRRDYTIKDISRQTESVNHFTKNTNLITTNLRGWW